MPVIKKQFEFGGVDYTSHNIARPDGKARDARNVKLDHRRRLLKRQGFTSVGWTPVVGGETLSNMYPVIYRTSANSAPVRRFLVLEKDAFLSITKAKIYDPLANTFTEIYGSYQGFLTIIQNNKPAYYNNVSYFVGTGGAGPNGGIAKFDGYDFYDSGMGPDTITYVGAGATSRYIRTCLAHLDGQGNWVYGDFEEVLRTYNVTYTIADTVPSVSVNSHLIYTAIVNGNQTPVPNGSGDVTITVDSGHNLQPLMWVIIRANASGIIMAQVKSKTTTTVTFDGTNPRIYADDGFGNVVWQSYFGGLGLTYNDNTKFARGLRLIYQSAGATATDFNFITYMVVGGTSAGNAITITPASPTSVPVWAPWTSNFEDFYDEEVVKGWVASYEIKSATIYNNIMVVSDGDLVYFSDLSLGSSVENFAPFDNFEVGSSEFGQIVGVFATESFLIVHRQYESYYISGNIVTGNYRVQPMNTTSIGLAGPGSPVRFTGGEIFMSLRGIHFASYSNSEEISEDIEPVFTEDKFTGSLFQSAYSCVDYANELVLISLPNTTLANGKVLVFCYKFKEWFVWDLPVQQLDWFRDASGILKLIYCNEDGIYVENSTYEDDGAAIDAWYQTNWFDEDEPSLDKKYLRIDLFSTESSEAFDIKVKSYQDWNESTVITDTEEAFTATKRTVGVDLAGNRSLSHTITLQNDVLNEAMTLTGFSLDYEPAQSVSKIK